MTKLRVTDEGICIFNHLNFMNFIVKGLTEADKDTGKISESQHECPAGSCRQTEPV